jgi:DNA-binding transcriptional MerR regulator
MQFGTVSKRTGLSADAIRFYERQRLLERPARTTGGFRLFQAEDVRRIIFIRRAQQLGFSLSETRELLLLLQRDRRHACSHVRDLLRAKVQAVHEKVRQLENLEKELMSQFGKCERNLRTGKTRRKERCPMLEEAKGK